MQRKRAGPHDEGLARRSQRAAAMLRSLAPVFAALTLMACAGDEAEPLDDLDDLADLGKGDGPLGAWTGIGVGVAYQQVTTGGAVLIAYGGYSAKLSYAAAWATELVDAKLGAVDVGHVYAVKGPADAAYAAREIANTKLRAHLLSLAAGTPIYIVAHSSGAFVAHELLAQAHAAGDTELLSRIAYANLDGGGSGLTTTIVAALGAITFVSARDPAAGRSQNSSTMRALGTTYAAYGSAFEVVVPGTGCQPGAGWCLHDVVITQRPHDPSTYDLSRDYTDFVDRPVTTAYLDPLLPVR